VAQLVRVDDRAHALDLPLGHVEDQHADQPALAIEEQRPRLPVDLGAARGEAEARAGGQEISVASVRSRLVMTAPERSGCRASRMLIGPDNAVSSWTIISGSADATAWAIASGSRASATTGRARRR
jgi:hypothetical protein